MEGNPDPPLTVPPDKQSNSIDTADDLIPSEPIVDGTQDGNKSNRGSVYAVHDTAEREESGEVTTESSSEDGEEYEYTNGFFVNKSHDNLLTRQPTINRITKLHIMQPLKSLMKRLKGMKLSCRIFCY